MSDEKDKELFFLPEEPAGGKDVTDSDYTLNLDGLGDAIGGGFEVPFKFVKKKKTEMPKKKDEWNLLK